MALGNVPEDLSIGGRHGRMIVGPSAFQCATGGRTTIDLTGNPCATGGSHVIQLVDGEVSRVIATRMDGVAVPGPRPARRGEMRVCNRGGGMNITIQASMPVRIRTIDGQEQIAYRTSEMDEGRLYTVEWNGEHYALRKSGQNVEVFKFKPGGDGDGD